MLVLGSWTHLVAEETCASTATVDNCGSSLQHIVEDGGQPWRTFYDTASSAMEDTLRLMALPGIPGALMRLVALPLLANNVAVVLVVTDHIGIRRSQSARSDRR